MENEIRLYGVDGIPGPQIPFNFELISYMNSNSNANDFKQRIDSWMDLLPQGCRANWVVGYFKTLLRIFIKIYAFKLGNHDNKRLATRFGVEKADLLNILLQTLPGVAVTYNVLIFYM